MLHERQCNLATFMISTGGEMVEPCTYKVYGKTLMVTKTRKVSA